MERLGWHNSQTTEGDTMQSPYEALDGDLGVLFGREGILHIASVKTRWLQLSGGERKHMEELKKLFDRTVDSFIKRKLITSEQGIFTWMIKKYPYFFEVVQSNHYDRIIYNVANSPGRKL